MVNVTGDTVNSKPKRIREGVLVGESTTLTMSIKPTEIGDSVPLGLKIECETRMGKKIEFSENIGGVRVSEKIVQKVPEQVVKNFISTGDMAVGGQVVKDSVQLRSGFNQPSDKGIESIFGASSGYQSPKERFDPYKEVLRKWHNNKIDDMELHKRMQQYQITEKEHKNLNNEVIKELESGAKDGVVF